MYMLYCICILILGVISTSIWLFMSSYGSTACIVDKYFEVVPQQVVRTKPSTRGEPLILVSDSSYEVVSMVNQLLRSINH